MADRRHGENDGTYVDSFLTSRDGLRLFYRDYRQDRRERFAVLCLPGLARNGRDFHDFAVRLSARYRVLCPDFRGTGRSQWAHDWRTYTPISCLDDLRHLLASAGVHEVVATGISYGGILAVALTVAAVGAVRGVVINDIGPEMIPGSMDRVLNYVGRDYHPADWMDAVAYLKQSFPGLPLRTEERWLEFAHNTFRENDGRLCVEWDTALARPLPKIWREHGNLWPLFRGLARVPTLAIRGAQSDILSPALFARMEQEIGGLNAVTVPDAGHVPDLAARPLYDRVEAFIESICQTVRQG